MCTELPQESSANDGIVEALVHEVREAEECLGELGGRDDVATTSQRTPWKRLSGRTSEPSRVRGGASSQSRTMALLRVVSAWRTSPPLPMSGRRRNFAANRTSSSRPAESSHALDSSATRETALPTTRQPVAVTCSWREGERGLEGTGVGEMEEVGEVGV